MSTDMLQARIGVTGWFLLHIKDSSVVLDSVATVKGSWAEASTSSVEEDQGGSGLRVLLSIDKNMKGRGCLLVVLLTIDCDRANIHLIVEVVIPVELVDEISKNHGLKTAREDLSPDEKALGLVKVHPNQKLSRIKTYQLKMKNKRDIPIMAT